MPAFAAATAAVRIVRDHAFRDNVEGKRRKKKKRWMKGEEEKRMKGREREREKNLLQHEHFYSILADIQQ